MKCKQILAACFIGTALLHRRRIRRRFLDNPPCLVSPAAGCSAGGQSLLWALHRVRRLYRPHPQRRVLSQLLVNLVQKEMRQDIFGSFPPEEPSYFQDIGSSVSQYAPGGQYDMYYAAAYGITEGALVNGQRLADTNALLTREQAAKMICSAITFLEEDVVGGELMAHGSPKSFADAASISAWASSWEIPPRVMVRDCLNQASAKHKDGNKPRILL